MFVCITLIKRNERCKRKRLKLINCLVIIFIITGIVTLLQTAGVSLAVETLAGGMGTLGFGTTFGFSKLMEKLVGVGVGQRIRNAIGPSQMKTGKLEEHVRKILEEFKALLEK